MIVLKQDLQTFLVRGDDEEGLLVSELAAAVAALPNGWVLHGVDCEPGENGGEVWAIRLRRKKLRVIIDTDKDDA